MEFGKCETSITNLVGRVPNMVGLETVPAFAHGVGKSCFCLPIEYGIGEKGPIF